MSSARLLTGRLALITGGGNGIGRAVCQAFAKEGALIACVDKVKDDAEKTVQDLPPADNGEHKAFDVDVSSSRDVNKLLKNINSTFSRAPCVTVNSAGIIRDTFIFKMTEQMFDEVIDVNLKGTFLVCQGVGKLIAEQKIQNGSIINIASIIGKTGNVGQANYASSKSGLIGLTKTAAKEFARYGIRVNCILPGFITTSMTASVPDKVLKQGILPLIPMGKLGKPEDIAEACVFLASDKSSYITGASLEVTGGLFM